MTERVTPHNLEAERAVLGGIFVNQERFYDAAQVIDASDFFRREHAWLFAVFKEFAERGDAIDLVTVRNRLAQQGRLDDLSPAYLSSLVDGVPRSTNVEHYARIVKDRADLRRLITTANKILADIDREDASARDQIDAAEQAIFRLAQQSIQSDFIDARQLVDECFAAVQTLYDTKAGITGVSTGFQDFDEMTRGLQPGSLVLIAARPSMGKTAFALNLAYHAAASAQTVGFFSIEMSRQEVFMRMLSGAGRIDSHRLQSGYLNQTEFASIGETMSQIAETHLHIDDSPTIGMLDVRGKARRLKARAGLSLIVLDYLQLMQLPRSENRNTAVGEISRGLKLLARELQVPVVALSQLSRDTEKRGGEKRPMLSDLRDSGALEQDADLVVFIHRPEVYGETPENRAVAEIIIAKQRNGPTGVVRLHWSKEFTRFDNWSSRN